jgi:HK97 family phage major capsid protein
MNKRYKALLQERADLINEAKGILAGATGRDLTAEEAGRDDAINARLNTLAGEIDREERLRRMEATMPGVPVTGAITDMHDLEAERPFRSLGEQLAAVYQAARAPHSIDRRLLALTGAGESGTSGEGFLVQQEFSNEIMARVYNSGQLTSRVNRRSLGANANGIKVNMLKETSRANGSRWGGVRTYWGAEGGTLAGSKPAYRRFALDLEKLMGLYVPTDELLQDVTALEGEVGDLFTAEITFTVEDAITNGDGAGKPLGYMRSAAKVTVAKEGGQAADTIVYDNLLKMWARMWGPSRANAVWLYNQNAEPQLHKLALPVGTAALPAQFIQFGQDGSLRAFGRPMIPVEYNSTVGDEGDLALVDLSQYRWIDKGGVQTASSIHVYFTTDEMAYRFIYRCNGAPVWEAPLTPFKGTDTLSPIVTLAERA